MTAIVPVTDQDIQRAKEFIGKTFSKTGKTQAVVAVSGGIDSAVSLTLACQALGAENVHPIFLPFEKQSVQDSQIIASFNSIPVKNWQTHNIERLVTAVQSTIGLGETSYLAPIRLGNIMARTRMIIVYDVAKQLDALVCGTENKSEKYLSYFTRFGDEASDLEPIQHVYKTQVRELARLLGLPEIFLTKAPSAGLWQDQEDEIELGFSYQDADLVMTEYIDNSITDISIIVANTGLTKQTVTSVIDRIESTAFKHQVPYTL